MLCYITYIMLPYITYFILCYITHVMLDIKYVMLYNMCVYITCVNVI